MKKLRKKMLITAVATMIACSLSAGAITTAFADEATKNHEFDARNGDVVFEDFDRATLEPVVSTTTTDKTDLGEAPYLHVEFDAMPAGTAAGARNGWIYKQGSPDLATLKNGGDLIITMRAPEGDVLISDLCLGVRGVDNENNVLVKNFGELYDGELGTMPALSTEWRTYEISFANSYEESEKYPGTETPVIGGDSADILGIHIFPVEEKAGTLDIASIAFGSTLLNNFTGGDDVQAAAKAANANTWWAGSGTDDFHGEIVKRIPTLTNGGDLLVVKDTAVGDYDYAVIETVGDAANLKVATTTNGTSFGTPAAYDGWSVTLNGDETGFKFTYDGETSVGIKRIYLTNLVAVVPDRAMPVIDATTAELLDDFSVAQTGINDDYGAMSTAPEAAAANMYYRLSYSNGDKIEIRDGELIIDPSAGYVNLKFNSKTLHTKDYVVLKVKLEGEGNLDALRFGLMGADDATTSEVWAPAFKSGVQYATKLLDGNPYKDGDWYYIIVNIAESGFPHYATGYSGMNLYYDGTAILHVDEIFFANRLELPKVAINPTEVAGSWSFTPSADGYQYAFGLDVPENSYGQLEFTLTPGAGFDGTELRFEVGGKTYWIAQHPDVAITADGKTYGEITFTEGTPVNIVINLEEIEATGVFNAMHFHTAGNATGAFTVTNLVFKQLESAYTAKAPDNENAETLSNIDFEATDPGYQYAGAWENYENQPYATLALEFTPGAGCTGPTGIRLSFGNLGTRWCVDNQEGVLITTDGNRVDEYIAAYMEEHQDYAGGAIPIVIDLEASGIYGAFNIIHIHTGGTDTGSFTMSNVTLTPYVDFVGGYYGASLNDLPKYLETVPPTVTINNDTTAKVGDVITVSYTASDNASATADLTVEITVVKDGNPVTLDGGKFTAEEGVYTITVKVTDLAGNEAVATKQITVTADGTGTGTGTNPGGTTAGEDEGGLGTGAIVGIVVGVVAVVALAVVLFIVIRRKKK